MFGETCQEFVWKNAEDNVGDRDQDVAGETINGSTKPSVLKQLDGIGKDSCDARELLQEHQHDGYQGRQKIFSLRNQTCYSDRIDQPTFLDLLPNVFQLAVHIEL